MASPDRIARAADARSPARSTMLSPGDAATCSTNAREVSDRSASTMTTPSPRITGWLKTAVSTAKANSGLIHGALAFVQRVGRLVEPGDRGVAVFGQLADPVIGFLRQDHARLRPLERCLFRGDDLRACAGIDVGELRIGNDLRGERLLVLCDRLRIVDLDQH